MNYPIWDLPASGLLIAAIAVFHVFVSHFAIGGGLFLVLLERRARQTLDQELLEYVKSHSRFFILLTLVAGAITGVGIWFTIGLVHPQATSTLIQTFVWVWAIEWTFFVTEIAAAMVYYYGWDRLSSRDHLTVGWIYLASAWLSLFAINGILTFMMTPGAWLQTGALLDAFFNPTFWPSLFSRTLVCVGLAGLYALMTVSFSSSDRLKEIVGRYASLRWIIPSALALPLTLLWYLKSAESAGIPVPSILGTEESGFLGIFGSILTGENIAGYPLAQRGVFYLSLTALLIVSLTLVFGVVSPRWLRPAVSLPLLLAGLVAFGGAEFVRENLRKPYVLGGTMFVNGTLLPTPSMGVRSNGEDVAAVYSLQNLNQSGVLPAARWVEPSLHWTVEGEKELDSAIRRGREVFRLLCSSCHTVEGHLGIGPLVAGQSQGSIGRVITSLAVPAADLDGMPGTWEASPFRFESWKNRRMPPFVGTESEALDLSVFLDSLDGVMETAAEVSPGQQVFEERCAFCHGADADWAMISLVPGLTAGEFTDRIGRLPEISPIMPPFDGTEEEKAALADYLEQVVSDRGIEGE